MLTNNQIAIIVGGTISAIALGHAGYVLRKRAKAKKAGVNATALHGTDMFATLLPTEETDKSKFMSELFAGTSHIPFNRAWMNRTEYLDGAAKHSVLPLEVGELRHSIDNFRRRVYIIGGGKRGNIVVFNRYTDDLQFWVSNHGPVTQAYLDIVPDDGSQLTLVSLWGIAKYIADIQTDPSNINQYHRAPRGPRTAVAPEASV